MSDKIKVLELAIKSGTEIVIRTSGCIAPIKLYRLQLAIEDFINRPMYDILRDNVIEYTLDDGKKMQILRTDLDRLFKAVYPELTNIPK